MSVWHGHPDQYSGALGLGRVVPSADTFQAMKAQEAMIQHLKDSRDRKIGQAQTMLERLKRFTRPDGEQDRAAVDEMMELAAFGRSLAAEYAAQEIPAPKWLLETLAALSRQIKARHRADMEGELRKAEKEMEALKSREEKKTEKEMEIARLRKALGG